MLVLLRDRGEKTFSAIEIREATQLIRANTSLFANVFSIDDANRALERIRQRESPILFIIDAKMRLLFHTFAGTRRDVSLASLLAPKARTFPRSSTRPYVICSRLGSKIRRSRVSRSRSLCRFSWFAFCRSADSSGYTSV